MYNYIYIYIIYIYIYYGTNNDCSDSRHRPGVVWLNSHYNLLNYCLSLCLIFKRLMLIGYVRTIGGGFPIHCKCTSNILYHIHIGIHLDSVILMFHDLFLRVYIYIYMYYTYIYIYYTYILYILYYIYIYIYIYIIYIIYIYYIYII